MAVELTLFRSNFNAYRSDVAEYVNNIISSIDRISEYLVDIIFQNNNFHQAMGEYFGFDIIFNPDGDLVYTFNKIYIQRSVIRCLSYY